MTIRGRGLGTAGAAIVALLALVAAPASAVDRAGTVPARVAAAKATPAPVPGDVGKRTSKVTEVELRAAVDAWQLANKAYKAALAARAQAIVAINETFTTSVKHAKADFDATKAQVNTPSAKSAAAARFADAVSAASAVRQAALDALPPLPPNPGPRPTAKSLAALRQQPTATPSPFAG